MTKIKTREVQKGTIKSLNKSEIVTDKMKKAYAKTKTSMDTQVKETTEKNEQSNQTNYATDKTMSAAKSSFIKSKKHAVRGIKETQRRVKVSKANRNEVRKTAIKSASIKSNSYNAAMKKQAEKKMATKMQEGSRKLAKSAGKNVKRTARLTLKAAKTAIASAKALIAAIVSAGWISVIVIIICCLFGAAFYFFGDESSKNYIPVSPEVEAYTPVIKKYAKEEGIGEYIELIKAVMMQESGGRGTDPMHSSESPYNTSYPRKPGGITNAEYSIQVGVKTLKENISKAGVKNPVDMDHIRLAVQGYNFGSGYIDWAISRDGGYTVQNASDYSDKMAKENGWSSYGDKQYVANVLRYYPFGCYNYGVGNTVIVKIAADQIGNKGGQKFWSWYGFNSRVEWCACFVSWCAEQSGYLKSGTIPKTASVPVQVNWFKSKGQYQNRSYTPTPGDIIFFDWENNGAVDHVGIVEKCENGIVYTIEGNTSDTCARRQYTQGRTPIMGYGVPKY